MVFSMLLTAVLISYSLACAWRDCHVNKMHKHNEKTLQGKDHSYVSRNSPYLRTTAWLVQKCFPVCTWLHVVKINVLCPEKRHVYYSFHEEQLYKYVYRKTGAFELLFSQRKKKKYLGVEGVKPNTKTIKALWWRFYTVFLFSLTWELVKL